MQKRLRVALLFGGRSAEHEVSVLSARNVFRALDPARYDVVLIGVTRGGAWVLCDDLPDRQFPEAVPIDGPLIALLPGGSGRLVRVSSEPTATRELMPVDALFPVLHGPYGEDGSIQGYAELAGVPFVGSGIFGSAAAMDKEVAKRLLAAAGLPIPQVRTLSSGETASFEDLTAEFGQPLFVKPARLGSSVGISRVTTDDELEAALVEAFRHDDKVLVEAYVPGREVECGVLEAVDGTLETSLPGEILPTNRYSFYTYESKYLDEEGAVLKVPADLPPAVIAEVQDLSCRAFRTLGCEGMARVDFFLRPDQTLIVNEVNTIPGFTDISMYPKAFEASGVPCDDLVDRLIRHGLARADRCNARATADRGTQEADTPSRADRSERQARA